MPKAITNQLTADAYPTKSGAIIDGVYLSKGGWVTLPSQVFCQINHSPDEEQQGSEAWSEEFALPSGAHYLQPGIVGIRFRSFTTGNPVQVSAAIFWPYEPAIQLGGSGISTPGTGVGSLNFQHNDLAIATEPTIDFEDAAGGTNLIWTVVDDPANTRVKLTPTWANPTIFPHDLSTGPASATPGSTGVYIQASSSTGGGIWSAGTAAADNAFMASITGDTQVRFNIAANGNLAWGPGNAAPDTTLSRIAGSLLAIGGSSGFGNYQGGARSNSAGGPATLTPDAATIFNRWNLINANGTYTIAPPNNQPGSNQTGFFFLCLHNSSGGVVTLSFDVIYNAGLTAPANGTASYGLFVWNSGTSKWDLLPSATSIAD